MLMVGPELAPGSPLRTTHIPQVAFLLSSSPFTALLALFVSLVLFVLFVLTRGLNGLNLLLCVLCPDTSANIQDFQTCNGVGF